MSFKEDVKALREKFNLKVTDIVSKEEIVDAAKDVEKVEFDKEKFEDVVGLNSADLQTAAAPEE